MSELFLIIGGDLVVSEMKQEVLHFKTAKRIATIPVANSYDVDAAIRAASGWSSFQSLANLLAVSRRVELLQYCAEVVRMRKDELAQFLSLEWADCQKNAYNEVEVAASIFEEFAKNAIPGLYPEHNNAVAIVGREAHSLISIVYVLAQCFAEARPVVCIPGDHTPLTTINLAYLIREGAELTEYFSVLLGGGQEIRNRIINHLGIHNMMYVGGYESIVRKSNPLPCGCLKHEN